MDKATYDKQRRQNATEEMLEKWRAYSRKSYAINREAKIARVEKIRLRRKHILDDIKMEYGCMDCGYRTCPEALEFDHRPGTIKLFKVCDGHKYSAEKVEAEIDKCDIVCSNCHAIRTAKRRKIMNAA